MLNPEELELIRRSQNGETAAFDTLFNRYESRIFNYAYSLTRNQDDAADLAQEAFVRAYRSIRSFQGESSFATWLTRITGSLFLDMLKKRRNDPPLEEPG